MPKANGPSKLVIELCRALVAAGADRRTAYWINIDQIREALGVPLDELDVAVAYAVKKDLVRADGLTARPRAPALATTSSACVCARRDQDRQ